MRHIGLILIVAGVALSFRPQDAGVYKYTATKSCSTADCHGAAAPNGKTPGLNEYDIWKKQDDHAKAYTLLYQKESKAIADALGIKQAAKDARCTDCHGVDVPADRMIADAKWSASLGVQCETCHGPAEKWLTPHTKTEAVKWEHEESVKNGMMDLRNLKVWAETCVSCHLKIDPALIAAGHPRMNFELVYYNANNPPHWDTPDHPSKAEDFNKRAWAVGAVVSMRDAVKAADAELVEAYRTVLQHVADVSGEPNEDLVKKLDALAGTIGAPPDGTLDKIKAESPKTFDAARQVALAIRALGGSVEPLMEMIQEANRASFDAATFKAAMP